MTPTRRRLAFDAVATNFRISAAQPYFNASEEE